MGLNSYHTSSQFCACDTLPYILYVPAKKRVFSKPLLVTVLLFCCYTLDTAKDLFREASGLQSVLSLVTSLKQEEAIEAGLYCLGSAVERNGRQ